MKKNNHIYFIAVPLCCFAFLLLCVNDLQAQNAYKLTKAKISIVKSNMPVDTSKHMKKELKAVSNSTKTESDIDANNKIQNKIIDIREPEKVIARNSGQ